MGAYEDVAYELDLLIQQKEFGDLESEELLIRAVLSVAQQLNRVEQALLALRP